METTKYVTEKKSQKCFKNLETNGNGNITNQNSLRHKKSGAKRKA